MTVKVQWLNLKQPDVLCRGYWDQGLIEDLFSGYAWDPVGRPAIEHEQITRLEDLASEGAIVVIPARHNATFAHVIGDWVGRMAWAVVILTGDEEHTYDARFPESVAVWTMHPGLRRRADVAIGSGYPPITRPALRQLGLPDKKLDWFFAGQVTHSRRVECCDALVMLREAAGMDESSLLIATPGFTQGLPPVEYVETLASAKIAPCPSGPVCVDSFRLYEALEAGCVPVADGATPAALTPWYWEQVHPDAPFPIVERWHDVGYVIDKLLDDWPRSGNLVFAWWQQHKRALAYKLWDQVAAGSGTSKAGGRITTIITSSPSYLHPSTEHLDETVESVLERLPGSDIIVTFDGVHPAQEGYTEAYGEFVRRALWKMNTEWDNVMPLVLDTHSHQANTTRAALRYVRSTHILFLEHDTPLVGDPVPWDDLCDVIDSGTANVIRLHHEASVLPPHQHMMLDRFPDPDMTVPLLRTAQWSQRSHIASADWYRWMLGTYFDPKSRTMIEDVLHGPISQAWFVSGLRGWEDWRIWLYAPDGDIKRSWHMDARGEDEKVEMVFAYPGGVTPSGAPRETQDVIDLGLS